MQGWSFFNLYVRGMRSRATEIIAWVSLAFIIGFWTWYLASGGWSMEPEESAPAEEPVLPSPNQAPKEPPTGTPPADVQKMTLHVPGMTERLALT